MATSAPNLRVQQKEQTRNQLVETAMSLFIEKGYENVTLTSVAEHSGIHVQTLYKHFRTKVSLATCFFDRYLDVALEVIDGFGETDNVYALWKTYALKNMVLTCEGERNIAIFEMIHANEELLAYTQFRVRQLEDKLKEAFQRQQKPAYSEIEARLLASMMVGAYRDAHFEWVRSHGQKNSISKLKRFHFYMEDKGFIADI